MALSLSAEQKDLKSIFLNDDKYLIPIFQRPYSWTDEELMQLYYDLTNAFQKDEEYFLGSIVLAKSRFRKGVFEVIDGQQRLVSLWVILKILAVIMPNVATHIHRMLMLASWDEDEEQPKIAWDEDLGNQNEQLATIAEWTKDDFSSNHEGKIYKSAQILFSYFNEYINKLDDERIVKFREYILRSVYLLPIELTGDTNEDAMTKALTVFETINDRGKDLLDADIFKSRLYKMASTVGKAEEMRLRWSDIENECNDADISVDDLFRIYSHIIRGRNSVTSNEKKLRDFYLVESFSPLLNFSHEKVFEELEYILDAISEIKRLQERQTRVSAWLQILNAYTNKYPWYALVVYAYKSFENKKLIDENKLSEFIQSLIRYCYAQGSTTSVKFEIYSIIARVMKNQEIPDYRKDKSLDPYYQFYPGRTKTGLTLLIFYLDNPNLAAIPNVKIDRILKQVDRQWFKENLEPPLPWSITESLVNYIVIDGPKRYQPFCERFKQISMSKITEIRNQLPSHSIPSPTFFQNRSVHIEKVLNSFFTK